MVSSNPPGLSWLGSIPNETRIQAACDGGIGGAFDNRAAVLEQRDLVGVAPELEHEVVVLDRTVRSAKLTGRWTSWICTEFLPHMVICGRPSPFRWGNSSRPQVAHPARGWLAEISAVWLVHTSQESNVRRNLSFAATRNLIASVACTDPTRFTAEFRIPAVSHVSNEPSGGDGKIQLRHAVSPGST